MRLILTFVACLVALGAGCKDKSAGEVHLVLGSLEEERATFEAKTALAEYVGLATGGSELRVILANYSVACQTFEPPGPGQYLVTVTISTPPGHAIRDANYPWIGSVGGAPDTDVEPLPSRAVASARSSSGSHPIKPGGHVRLTKVELEPFGGVSGLLAFESAGDVGAPATSIRGRFSARLCRFTPGAVSSR